MLIRILRTFLAPYRRPLAAVLILSLVGTMASLYLPSLNAAIIDEGVAKGVDRPVADRSPRVVLRRRDVRDRCHVVPSR